MDIFEIVGPVMIGPSSSHTAGANRIGKISRSIFGKAPTKADIKLYNSFSKTGKGHGTDKAMLAGIMGHGVDDPIIKNAYEEAFKAGLEVNIEYMGENPEEHPNLAEVTLYKNEEWVKIKGISLGGGRVMIVEIDGYKTEFYGNKPAMITVHNDVPGIVATVSKIFAQMSINIAYIHMYRNTKVREVLMIIETDDMIPMDILSEAQKIPEIKKVATISNE